MSRSSPPHSTYTNTHFSREYDSICVAPLDALTRAFACRRSLLQILAHFMEKLVLRFELAYANSESKACVNGTLLLSALYNFGALHCSIVYELIRRLCSQVHMEQHWRSDRSFPPSVNNAPPFRFPHLSTKPFSWASDPLLAPKRAQAT